MMTDELSHTSPHLARRTVTMVRHRDKYVTEVVNDNRKIIE